MNYKVEKIAEIIEEMSNGEQVAIFNEFCYAQNHCDDQYYTMNEFDEICDGMTPWEVARAAFYGDFCPAHNYFRWNAYGNFESCDFPEIDAEEIAAYIVENDNALYDSDIRDALDEMTDEEEQLNEKIELYTDYKEQRQAEFNALPIFFAFSERQFAEEMEKRGLAADDTDKVYSLSNGGFYLKSDADEIREYFDTPDELPELMKDPDFCEGAFYYEMQNHEYAINWQGDWDVFSCFGNVEYSDEKTAMDYADEIGLNDEQKAAFNRAKAEYMKAARAYC